MMKTVNMMIVGVGGQGSLLASKLLGHLLLTRGYDVKVSEVHGMSQRGGSVVTYVRFGDKVYAPVVDKGEADFIVSFEKLEAALSQLHPPRKKDVKAMRKRILQVLADYPTSSPAEQNQMLKTIVEKAVYTKSKGAKPAEFQLKVFLLPIYL